MAQDAGSPVRLIVSALACDRTDGAHVGPRIAYGSLPEVLRRVARGVLEPRRINDGHIVKAVISLLAPAVGDAIGVERWRCHDISSSSHFGPLQRRKVDLQRRVFTPSGRSQESV
jgi:hypothetical protein